MAALFLHSNILQHNAHREETFAQLDTDKKVVCEEWQFVLFFFKCIFTVRNEGNVFTGVCLSTGRGGGIPACLATGLGGGACSQGDACSGGAALGGACSGGCLLRGCLLQGGCLLWEVCSQGGCSWGEVLALGGLLLGGSALGGVETPRKQTVTVVDGTHPTGIHSCSKTNYSSVADPGFSKWGGVVLSQMGGVHILFSGKKCMKLKEIGLKWGGTRLLAPCYSKITIFL